METSSIFKSVNICWHELQDKPITMFFINCTKIFQDLHHFVEGQPDHSTSVKQALWIGNKELAYIKI